MQVGGDSSVLEIQDLVRVKAPVTHSVLFFSAETAPRVAEHEGGHEDQQIEELLNPQVRVGANPLTAGSVVEAEDLRTLVRVELVPVEKTGDGGDVFGLVGKLGDLVLDIVLREDGLVPGLTGAGPVGTHLARLVDRLLVVAVADLAL